MKLHGAVQRSRPFNEDNYVITEDHYVDYLIRPEISQLLPCVVNERLKNSHLLFLGYSLADWNLRAILRRIWSEQKLEYGSWAIQKPLAADADDAARAVWNLERAFWEGRVVRDPRLRAGSLCRAADGGPRCAGRKGQSASDAPAPRSSPSRRLRAACAPRRIPGSSRTPRRTPPFFFGRDAEARVIVANLLSRALTLLFGPSGVGKSSVLRAGVMGALRVRARARLEEDDSPGIVRRGFSEWHDDPLMAVRAACAEAAVSISSAVQDLPEPEPGATLKRGDRALGRTTRAAGCSSSSINSKSISCTRGDGSFDQQLATPWHLPTYGRTSCWRFAKTGSRASTVSRVASHASSRTAFRSIGSQVKAAREAMIGR